MTAEVGVLNRMGVALAADSAVTINASQSKIYTSADKLFQLTEHAPVGIMIYGSASLSLVPWETIIKEYRKQLKGKTFQKLTEYYEDFLKYITNKKNFYSSDSQVSYVQYISYNFLNHIRIRFKKILDAKLNSMSKKGLSEKDIKNIFSNLIKDQLEQTRQYEKLQNVPHDFIQQFILKYKNQISEVREAVFELIPMTKLTKKNIENLLGEVMSSERLFESDAVSGIVISGFGNQEYFPSLLEAKIAGYANDTLLYQSTAKISIDDEFESCVVPFAQKEMVYTFMNGIDPDYDDVICSSTENLFDGITRTMIDEIKKRDPELGVEIENKIIDKVEETLENLIKDWNSVRRSQYSNPVMQMVSSLPKDELGAMAESLVNLTKFKRRVSTQQETVGGPIDVAVITKGDGFVWIKRKHYFDPDLNPRKISAYCIGR